MGRSSHKLSTLSLLACVAYCVIGCDDATPGGGSEQRAAAGSDAWGPLPDAVAGFHVTRGAAPGYVPDAACADCHPSIYESYQSVGMARSFHPADADHAVETFGETFVHQETGFHYEMSLRDGKYHQKRYCVDEAGRRFAEHEQEVTWIVGSGNHARTYLTQNAHGELFELPMSWYTANGWGMSPGYEGAGHERFERLIERNCMFCHNAYPEVPVGNDVPGHSPAFPRDLPHGIGCQRCHGPGARHVEWADESATGDPRIFHPTGPMDSDNLCMTCHLQPDVWSGGESIVHAMDRPTYAHRPEQPVTDHMVYFDFGSSAERAQKIEINHHAYRMRQSACFAQSEGQLTCVSCHDPHSKPAPEDSAGFYAQKCQQCHELDDCQLDEMGSTLSVAPDDCVACHMFEARPRDVVEVTITDHLIRRRPPEQDLTAPRQHLPTPMQPEAIPYFDDRGPSGDLLDLYAGWASGDRRSIDRLQRWRASHEKLQPDMPYAWVTLGRALGLAGEVAGSIEVLADAERRFPADPSVQYNFALSLHLGGQHERAMSYVDKALAQRVSPPTLSLKGNLQALTRQVEAARATYEESLRLRPTSTKTWKAYASVLAELGELDASVTAYRRALALSPDEIDIYLVLRDIYRAQGKLDDLLRILEHGASRSDEVRLELVIAHLVEAPALRDPEKAQAIASAVTTRAPKNARAHAYLALAMIFSEVSQPAGPVIDAAQKLGADPACCSGLRVLDSLRRGDVDSANAHLARFQVEVETPSHERLRGPILRLVQASLRQDKR